MNLTEALKTKKEKLVLENDLQESFIEKVRSTELNKLWSYKSNKPFVDYENQDIKKRAQTIGLAFNIGVKILMEFLMLSNIKLSYADNGFFNKYREDEDMKKIVAELGEDYIELFNRVTDIKSLFSQYKNLNGYDGDKFAYGDLVMSKISSVAVSLAWLKAKYSSGFFPADVSVMLENSDTHIKLTKEVYRLLSCIASNDYIGELGLSTIKMPEVYIEPRIIDEETGLYEVIDFIIDDVACDLTTSSTYDEEKVDTTRLKSFKALNDKVKAYRVSKYSVDYVRHHATTMFK